MGVVRGNQDNPPVGRNLNALHHLTDYFVGRMAAINQKAAVLEAMNADCRSSPASGRDGYLDWRTVDVCEFSQSGADGQSELCS